MDNKEHEIGCGLQTFHYLEDFVDDLEQLTEDEKITIKSLVLDIIRETGRVAKAIVKESISKFISNGS